MALPPWPYPLWIAHRGAGKLAPENTLAAFRLGAAHGYRMYECDAKLSADGVVFLLHDTTLERTSNGHGVAGERTWTELSRLDAGGWHSRAFAGEPPATLASVARHCQANRHWLNIEIKPTPGAELETGRVVAAEAQRLWVHQPDRLPLLTSFRPESLLGAKQAAPDLPRGLLLDTLWSGWEAQAADLQVQALICNQALWDRPLVRLARAQGWRMLAYTVNDEWAAERLIDLGLDGIITDRVDLFAPVS
ncbi:MAG: glycerophosphodiester phosphodiesterase [Hydrogenophaga sp.]|uniref:glycerophosphodiester phosphodiesterase n=1 Tax=Hydrogenophaga sp. TaxID=1904254 RepID=UPI001D2A7963|nr:glycerophosphodiester phosphodiesterase [Hydrogenophaga sp.]MBX3609306.1 glycerophosphodiester phosphodiesterase [Hydrogenophaga sp.]